MNSTEQLRVDLAQIHASLATAIADCTRLVDLARAVERSLRAHARGQKRPGHGAVCERVYDMVAANPGIRTRELRDVLPDLRSAQIAGALLGLQRRGVVGRSGTHGLYRYHAT